ncbi:MAG: hypothetical protein Ct9H300mP2_4520 [Candidatus Neomarinimicrobiota bacterium]|nr:MAG: hypothetical protein Ct9H300mP2_4520 [Candidatus Neomarinimicrobiota bacterium]
MIIGIIDRIIDLGCGIFIESQNGCGYYGIKPTELVAAMEKHGKEIKDFAVDQVFLKKFKLGSMK